MSIVKKFLLAAPILTVGALATNNVIAANNEQLIGKKKDDAVLCVDSAGNNIACATYASDDQKALFKALIKMSQDLAADAVADWNRTDKKNIGQNISPAHYDCDGGGDGCTFQNYAVKLKLAQCRLSQITDVLNGSKDIPPNSFTPSASYVAGVTVGATIAGACKAHFAD